MTELRVLRRIEFALAAYGAAIVLILLVTGVDAIRFHLATALASGARPSLQDAAVIGLAVVDLAIVSLAVWSAGHQILGSRHFLRQLRSAGVRSVGEHRVVVIDDEVPKAFCAGLFRPRVHVSSGALRLLEAPELLAVVAHEAHHATRRDPLRILVARAIGDAYSFGALPRREQALSELAADDAAVRSRGAASLASALLAFHADSGQIAPARVDRLTGAAPGDEVPRALVAGAAAVIAGLVVLLLAGLFMPGHPRVCLPLASAPIWWLCAVTARLAAMGPAWLGWRRAGAFLA